MANSSLAAVSGIAATGNRIVVRCPLQKLEGELKTDGLWLRSTAAGDDGCHVFRVFADSAGRAVQTGLEGTGNIEITGSLARWQRPGLVEEYSVSPNGVRQDFIVRHRPRGDGPLQVGLNVAGASVEATTQGLHLVLHGSGRRLAYDQLSVADATGKKLNAWMRCLTTSRIAIFVDDHEAAYPLTIDPTFSDADWISMGVLPQASAIRAVAADANGNIYIGGDILSFLGGLGSPPAYVAKWDGNQWSPLAAAAPPGVNADVDGEVRVLVVSGNDLYAGGLFTTAGGLPANHIARFDTVNGTWSTVGIGGENGLDGEVRAIAVSGADLFVAGEFLTAGTTTASRIAKWDSTAEAWSNLGLGVSGSVEDLAVIGTDLYAGGSLEAAGGEPVSNMARWSMIDQQWYPLGAGVNGTVMDLTSSGANLIAGGYFTTAGGLIVKRIAMWNGSAWSALGDGFNGHSVNAVMMVGADLYAGGSFASSGGGDRDGIARLNFDGTLDAGFAPEFSGTVRCTARQANNKLVVGGQLTRTGETSANLARINVDNSPDTAFLPVINGPVNGVALQSNANLIVGGEFTAIGAVTRKGVARLTAANGALDPVFNANLGGPAFLAVYDVAVQPADQMILIGGNFTTVGGVSRTHLARLTSTGSLDANFAPTLNGDVVDILVQGDGKILIRGTFSTVNGVARSGLARLNSNGTLDTSHDVGAIVAGPVRSMALQTDSKLLVAGLFSATGNGTTRQNLARFNADGTLDATLGDADVDGTIIDVALQPNGKILIGGEFTSVGAMPRFRLARLNADGTLDTSVDVPVDGAVTNVAATNDTGVFFGGSFSAVGGTMLANIARWNGTAWSAVSHQANAEVADLAATTNALFAVGGFSEIDQTWNLGVARLDGVSGLWSAPGVGVDEAVRALLFHDGTLYVGGDFVRAGGVLANYIACWNGDAWSSLGFGVNGPVFALAVNEGALYAGGAFTTAGGQPAEHVARWDFATRTWFPLGSGLDGNARALAIDGNSLFAGGSFLNAGSLPVNNVARWNIATNAWSALNSGVRVQNSVYALAVTPDGLYVGGDLTDAGVVTAPYVARLLANGTIDSSYAGPIANAPATSAAVQADGSVILGTTAGTLVRHFANGIADTAFNLATSVISFHSINAIAGQSDGRILVGGRFTLPLEVQDRQLIRLNSDGSLDSTFAAPAMDGGASAVRALAVDSAGRILIGGAMTTVGGQSRPGLARLTSTGSLDLTFAPAAGGSVTGIVVQADGKIVVTTGTAIARFNADASIDAAFVPDWKNVTPVGISGMVETTGGTLVLAGTFNATAQITTQLVRLSADGVLDPTYFPPAADSPISNIALQPDGRILVIGGFFEVGANAVGIAKWNGAAWSGLGTHAVMPVNALAARGNDLYVAGDFLLPLAVGTAANIARWNGTAWSGLGSGGETPIAAVAADQAAIYTTSVYSGAGSVRRWNGSSWSNLGAGVDGNALALTTGGGQLFVGGQFTTAGGKPSNNLARTALPGDPQVVIEQPLGTSLVSGAAGLSFGSTTIGSNGLTKFFTIKNTGTADLTGLVITTDGSNPGNYVVSTSGMSTTVSSGSSTTFSVTFAPTGTLSGTRTAAIHVAGTETSAAPFDITVSGIAFSTTADADSDGLNDWAEFQMSALGFDWQANQPALVAALNNGANAAGLYTANQVQTLHVGAPLLQRDAATGRFTLTIGVEKSASPASLNSFVPFPMAVPQTVINGNGKLEFRFTTPDNAAFFKVRAE